MENIKYLLFDWGDTLMIDYPKYTGPMVTWEQVTPMPDVIETMPKISSRFRCAVASNAVESDDCLMKQAFERVGLDGYFSLFITSKELGSKKPSVSFFEGIAKNLNLPITEICMIGNDYNKDIVGAKNTGMKTILLTKQEGEYPLADFVIPSFAKLLDVFDKQR